HHRHLRPAYHSIRATSDDEHYNERGKKLSPGSVAQYAPCSTLLEPKRRKRIERECQPRGQVAQQEWSVIAPEPGEEETRADRERDERRDHRAGAAGQAIPFPRLEVAGEVRDVIDHTGVNRGRYDREEQRHRAHPQRAHGDMQDERGRIEGRQNRNDLVLPPLVRTDEFDEIVANETRIAQ